MARNFLGIPAQAYVGNIVTTPFRFRSGAQGTLIPLSINWAIYADGLLGQNGLTAWAVNVDYKLSLSIPANWFPKSVYIDNTGSVTPIYCYFPDTNYVVVCQPNSEGWFPVITNSLLMVVIGEGFVSTALPLTNILLTDMVEFPSTNPELPSTIGMELASQTTTRLPTNVYNTNYGVEALGDQVINYNNGISSTSGVFETGIFGTPLSSGFVYLTHTFVTIASLQTSAAVMEWVLESTGAAGTLFTFETNTESIVTLTVLDLQRTNIKLDATQTYRLRVTSATSGISWYVNHTFVWTTNPN